MGNNEDNLRKWVWGTIALIGAAGVGGAGYCAYKYCEDDISQWLRQARAKCNFHYNFYGITAPAETVQDDRVISFEDAVAQYNRQQKPVIS